MPRKVAIGVQDFSRLIENKCFFIDKTMFIKDWWENEDAVTLITRPRRFGKTLNMSMLECFFSNDYANRFDLFEGLKVWDDENIRSEQGAWPVVFLSLADIKTNSFEAMKEQFAYSLCDICENYKKIIRSSDVLDDTDKEKYFNMLKSLENGADETLLKNAVKMLCKLLYSHYGKKVIILLDEYDTPMLEAYVSGYWDEIVSFLRNFFNSTFKSNPYMYRAVLTGITRVSKESMFSDFNNLVVCTLSSERYQNYFGFTENEVFAAMDEFGYTNKDEVKYWYDGFTIGEQKDIYNPWSIINFLDDNKLKPYWANTSSNGLVSKLIREGNTELKADFETLLDGNIVSKKITEEMVYSDLYTDGNAVWSLLATSGYLRINSVNDGIYELQIVNYEVLLMFRHLITGWFSKDDTYGNFIKYLLRNDLKCMNIYMNKLTDAMFSSFDTGNKPSEKTEPERFYHGFVLGLMVELRDRYSITSNRESGYGRYDVMLEPKDASKDDAMIFEFKVIDTDEGEKELHDTVKSALKQIEDKNYAQMLINKGINADRIRKYGFAFQGKKVLIGS